MLSFYGTVLWLSFLLYGATSEVRPQELRLAKTVAELCSDIEKAMTGHPITLLMKESTDDECTFRMMRMHGCYKDWESLLTTELWKEDLVYQRISLENETISVTKNIFIIGEIEWVEETLGKLISWELLIYSHHVVVISPGVENRKKLRVWLRDNIRIGTSVVAATMNPFYCTNQAVSNNCESESWILEFVAPQPRGSSVLQTVGKWSEQQGLVMTSKKLFQVVNLKGFDLRLSLLNKKRNGTMSICSGWYKTLGTVMTDNYLSLVRDYLDCCYVVHFTSYSTIGTPRPNGTWNGHIGLLMKDEIDIAGRIMVAISTRMEVVDLTEWFDIGTTHVLVAGPYPEEKPFIIFEVFRYEVWLALIGAIIGTSAIKWMIAHAEKSIQRRIQKQNGTGAATLMDTSWGSADRASLAKDSINLTYQYHFFMTFRMTCLEPTIENTAWLASRVLHVMLWFTFISMCAGYSGNITSFMAIPQLNKPINNLMDLVNNPHVTPMVRDGNAHANYLKSAVTNATKFLYSRMMKDPEKSFVKWGIAKSAVAEMCASGKAAYIASKSYCTTAKDQNPSLFLHVASEPIKWDLYTFGLQKNSPYQERINLGMKRIKQHGLNIKVTNEYYFASALKGIFDNQNTLNDEAASIVFQLKHLQGAFYLLFTGLALAAISFAWEKFA